MHKTICNELNEVGTQVEGCSQARHDCGDSLMEQFKTSVVNVEKKTVFLKVKTV